MSSLEDSDGRIALLCSLKSRDLWLLVPRTSGRDCETKRVELADSGLTTWRHIVAGWKVLLYTLYKNKEGLTSLFI